MEVFICYGYVPSACGCCAGDGYEDVAVCTTEEEALGLVLDRYPETDAGHWDINKVDRSVFGICEFDE